MVLFYERWFQRTGSAGGSFQSFRTGEKVYVKTSDEYGVPQEHDSYEYTQEGINEDGQK